MSMNERKFEHAEQCRRRRCCYSSPSWKEMRRRRRSLLSEMRLAHPGWTINISFSPSNEHVEKRSVSQTTTRYLLNREKKDRWTFPRSEPKRVRFLLFDRHVIISNGYNVADYSRERLDFLEMTFTLKSNLTVIDWNISHVSVNDVECFSLSKHLCTREGDFYCSGKDS